MAMTAAERQRRYRERHPERVNLSRQRYRERNRETLRRAGRVREQARRDRIRAEVISALGGACSMCGFHDKRALQVDHVNDDGSADRIRFGGRLSPNALAFYQAVIAEAASGRYQLLCANCNTIKEWERKRRLRAGGL